MTHLSLVASVLVSVLSSWASPIGQAEPQAGNVYRNAAPAVVLIEVYDLNGKVAKTGTGFLISADGRILTNYHVLEHSKRATVRLANRDAYDDVDVLDVDRRKDIALIKIKAVDVPFLTLGKSSTVQIGDPVVSVTNPLGLFQNTLSTGIVSGIRSGDGYKYFQVSAPISSGSSGGPIFNAAGEVIGIATMIVEEGQNLNFAVPIDYARGMLSSNHAQPLASIYEPEPPPGPSTNAASAVATPAAPFKAQPSAEMKAAASTYLEKQIGRWTPEDAKRELGEPVSERPEDVNNKMPGTIYKYSDPTLVFQSFELDFQGTQKKAILHMVIVYPTHMTWRQAKALWGDNVRLQRKTPDGLRGYAYRNRRLLVLVDKDGMVSCYSVY